MAMRPGLATDAIYGRGRTTQPDLTDAERRRARAIEESTADGPIYKPRVNSAGTDDTNFTSVHDVDIAALSKFWITLGIPPAERDYAYAVQRKDTPVLDAYIDRLATLVHYKSIYTTLMAERERCKERLRTGIQGQQSSRHDLSVQLLTLRNLTLRLFSVVRAARQICQKPVLFPSMRLAPKMGAPMTDDWIAFVRDEVFMNSETAELLFIVLKFFESAAPSAINTFVDDFFVNATRHAKLLFGKHLLVESSAHKDNYLVSSQAGDELVELSQHSRNLTEGETALHLLLGIDFEVQFRDSDLPSRWLALLNKRSGASFVDRQAEALEDEPATLLPEEAWDMVKCEALLRERFVIHSQSLEKQGQKVVTVPVATSSWNTPETYLIPKDTRSVQPTPDPMQPHEDEAKNEGRSRMMREPSAPHSLIEPSTISAIDPGVNTPHDSSFPDNPYEAMGTPLINSHRQLGTVVRNTTPDVSITLNQPSVISEYTEGASMRGRQVRGENEIVFAPDNGASLIEESAPTEWVPKQCRERERTDDTLGRLLSPTNVSEIEPSATRDNMAISELTGSRDKKKAKRADSKPKKAKKTKESVVPEEKPSSPPPEVLRVANDPVSVLGDPSLLTGCTTLAPPESDCSRLSGPSVPLSASADLGDPNPSATNEPVFVLCDPSAFTHEGSDPATQVNSEASVKDAPAPLKAYERVKKEGASRERVFMMTDDINGSAFSDSMTI